MYTCDVYVYAMYVSRQGRNIMINYFYREKERDGREGRRREGKDNSNSFQTSRT